MHMPLIRLIPMQTNNARLWSRSAAAEVRGRWIGRWLADLADSVACGERGLVERHATTAFRRQVWNEVDAQRPVDERTQVGA